MAERVCPWWLGYFLINPVRHWRQNPSRILSPYVREGMTVLEPGPGMGYFTLELARLVGGSGRVIAIEIQRKMLDKLAQRAAKRGLRERIETRLAKKDSMGIGDLTGTVDFALAFAVVHELPDAARFFRETAETLKPGGRGLFAEPTGHVKRPHFEMELAGATVAGLAAVERPSIRSSQTALLEK